MRQSRGSSPELVSAVPAGFLGTEPLLPLPCPPPLSQTFEHDSYSGSLWTRPWTPAFSAEIPSAPVQPASGGGRACLRWPSFMLAPSSCPSASPVSAPLQQKRARREGARSTEGHRQCLSTHAQRGCGRLGQLGASSFPFLFPVLFFLSLPLTFLEHSRFF